MSSSHFPEDELGVTSAPLMAASFYIGDQCQTQNDDFMFCKEKNKHNPHKCLAEGIRVKNCVRTMYIIFVN